jgi:hypothetical protein
MGAIVVKYPGYSLGFKGCIISSPIRFKWECLRVTLSGWFNSIESALCWADSWFFPEYIFLFGIMVQGAGENEKEI